MKVIGLMSGTSCDGVDVALIDISGKKIKCKAFETYPYSKKMKQHLLEALNMSLEEVAELNSELGDFFGNKVKEFLKTKKTKSSSIYCIGSHGQTVIHRTSRHTKKKFTMQLGEASHIATITGIDVVSDFRQKDIAMGGEGAPLSPFFHFAYFGNKSNVAIHNLGGFSNITVIPVANAPKKVIAFDSGPANYLIDEVMRAITNGKKHMDKNGHLAKKGKIHYVFIDKWMKHHYFKKDIPKSCGKSDFYDTLLYKILKLQSGLDHEDLVATVTELTAQSIIEAYRKFVLPRCTVKEVIFCGGGVYNQTLMKSLDEKLQAEGIAISSFDDYGISSDAVEAVCFGYLGYLCMKKKVNHLAHTTGAKKNSILGKISYCS